MTTNGQHNETMSTHTEVSGYVQLANAWLARGNFARASTYYSKALELDADHGDAHYGLGRISLQSGKLEDALEEFVRALQTRPDDYELQMQCDAVYEQLGGESGVRLVPDMASAKRTNRPTHVEPKLCLDNQVILGNHRHGWGAALQALRPLHDPAGVLFDGSLEYNFLARHNGAAVRPTAFLEELKRQGTFEKLATAEEMGIIPYRSPWVGFIHHTPNMPADIEHYAKYTLQELVGKPVWQESMASCIGLFTLSEYNAGWLREQTGKPVSTVFHPIETPPALFDMDRFRNTENKNVVQIGWWLRRLDSIFRLPLPKGNALNYTKVWLRPSTGPQVTRGLRLRDRQLAAAASDLVVDDEAFRANTVEMKFLSNDEYDDLLASSVAFIDLYDSSVNNTVVECMVGATPLLINRHPAVIEYLGADYPLFFDTLDEAADKALDLDLIAAAHEHMLASPVRPQLTGQHFMESVAASDVYQLI